MALQLPPFFAMEFTDKEGRLTPNALLYMDLTYQVLNTVVNYFNSGIPMPQATTAQIIAYGADTTVALGSVWFNTTLAKLQVKTGVAIIETITSV